MHRHDNAFDAINHRRQNLLRLDRALWPPTLNRSWRSKKTIIPPTTSAVNITITLVPRGRTIVIGDPLSILYLSGRESSEFPPPRTPISWRVSTWQIRRMLPDGSYRYASAIRTAVYYGSLSDMYLCFPYHFAIIDNIVKAFCRKQWVITCLL